MARLLARKLCGHADAPNVIVLALPRGGVPVDCEVARALNAPLDVFVVRKLGVPAKIFSETTDGEVRELLWRANEHARKEANNVRHV